MVSHEASRTGAPRVAVSLLNALSECGWATSVVHRHGGPLRALMDDAADSTRNEYCWRVRGQLRRAGFARSATKLERASARHDLKRRRPDLVWANTTLAVPYVHAACDLGIPVVWYVHEQPDHVDHVISRYRDWDGLRDALMVGCSPEAIESLERSFGTTEGTVRLLTPPVDTESIWRQADGLRREARKSGQVTVVGIGTGDPRKGVDIFSSAAERSRETGIHARWRWVGRPPTNRSTAVEWVGEVDDPIPEMARATIVAVPSRAEGYPLVVMEAMSAGATVVASDLPGIRDQVGSAGLLIPKGDVDALFKAVTNLLGDDKRRAQLGSDARRRSSRFDVASFARQVSEISEGATQGGTMVND